MIIQNAKVFEENGTFSKRDIFVKEGLIADTAQTDSLIDAEGCYAVPGLIDVHVHGCVRQDFSSADRAGIGEMALYQARQGITGICPTLLTLPEKELADACARCADWEGDGAEIVGIHLEGPFLSPKNAGAQNPAHIHKPDFAMYQRLQKAAQGKVKLLSIAPEMPGALDFIAALQGEISCSIAHTKADYDMAREAFLRGANHVTHLFNAMPPLLHREPGVIGAAAENLRVMAELICDGVHVHPSSVRAAFSLFGEERIVLISDSMMATGLADGAYTLGDLPVTVQGNRATLTGTETIAGSVTNLMDCLRSAVRNMDIPLGIALRCATVNAAKSIGVYDNYGSLTPGKAANIVLLEQDLSIRSVIMRGRILEQ